MQHLVLDALRVIIIQLEQLVGSPLIGYYIEATIASASDGAGYGVSGTGQGANHSEYIHHSKVDGTTKYGAAWCFPRRNMIGGCWKNNIACGSRALVAYNSTAKTDLDLSVGII